MTTKIIIIGAGGHGRVIADIIDTINTGIQSNQFTIVGYLDDDTGLEKSSVNLHRVIGPLRKLSVIEHDAVVIAIGDNTLRKRIFLNLLDQGEHIISIIHSSSIISNNVEVGQGVQIIGGVVINTESRIGQNSIINTSSSIDHNNWIGDHVHIAPGVHLGGDVFIGDDTFIGMGTIIAPRVKIGRGCTIGAGSVVLKNIAEGEFAYGTPAKPQGRGKK